MEEESRKGRGKGKNKAGDDLTELSGVEVDPHQVELRGQTLDQSSVLVSLSNV